MKKMNTITIVALILIFFGGVGAVLLAVGQSKSSSDDKSEIIKMTKDENSNLKSDILELKNERNELANLLDKRDSVLQAKNDKIIDLNTKLTEKSEYIQNFVTGGDGYPIIDVEHFSKTNANQELTGMFKIRVESKFPIYNLQVNIFDYDKLISSFKNVSFSKKPLVTMSDFNGAKIISQKIEELSPIQTRYIDKKIKLVEARYFIQLQARNNIYIQKIVCRIYNNILYFGSQTFTLEGKLIVQSFGENTSKEIQSKLSKEMSTISIINDFDLIE